MSRPSLILWYDMTHSRISHPSHPFRNESCHSSRHVLRDGGMGHIIFSTGTYVTPHDMTHSWMSHLSLTLWYDVRHGLFVRDVTCSCGTWLIHSWMSHLSLTLWYDMTHSCMSRPSLTFRIESFHSSRHVILVSHMHLRKTHWARDTRHVCVVCSACYIEYILFSTRMHLRKTHWARDTHQWLLTGDPHWCVSRSSHPSDSFLTHVTTVCPETHVMSWVF